METLEKLSVILLKKKSSSHRKKFLSTFTFVHRFKGTLAGSKISKGAIGVVSMYSNATRKEEVLVSEFFLQFHDLHETSFC